MTDQSMQTITEDIEKELLQIIIKNLEQHKFTVFQARQLAKEFIALLPLQDKKDLLDKLYKFELQHT